MLWTTAALVFRTALFQDCATGNPHKAGQNVVGRANPLRVQAVFLREPELTHLQPAMPEQLWTMLNHRIPGRQLQEAPRSLLVAGCMWAAWQALDN